MCVPCMLKNKNLTMLIDSGSTHNLFDEAVMSKFVLLVIQAKPFNIMVADQDMMECVKQC